MIKKIPPKTEPYSPEWYALADLLARRYGPKVYPCGTCKQPGVDGYVCEWCGDIAPYEKYKKGNEQAMTTEPKIEGPYSCEPNPDTTSTKCGVTGPFGVSVGYFDDEFARALVGLLN